MPAVPASPFSAASCNYHNLRNNRGTQTGGHSWVNEHNDVAVAAHDVRLGG